MLKILCENGIRCLGLLQVRFQDDICNKIQISHVAFDFHFNINAEFHKK